MEKNNVILKCILALTMSTLIFAGCGKKSVEDEEFRFVKLEKYKGDVTVSRSDKELDITSGMMLQPKDIITTGNNSDATILADSDKHISENANSSLSINAKGDDKEGSIKVELLYGDAVFIIDNKLNNKSSFEVVTPNATLSVRGTTFQVAYDKETDSTYVEVAEGVVYADYEGDASDEEINAGELRIITEDEVYDNVDEGAWDINFELFEILDVVNDYAANTSSDENTGEDVSTENGYSPISGDAYTQYNNVISNMKDFVTQQDRLQDKYYGYDYAYFDYDKDGENEVILYLRYNNEDNEDVLDLCFLDYTASNGVYVLACNTGDISSFYAEYNGNLVRYSYNTHTMESYIYRVDTTSSSLIYVLEEAYDTVLSDFDEIGLHPLPLYDEWTLLPE